MLWDFDNRPTSLMALMQYEMPFMAIMPDEYIYEDDGSVAFIFSDLGVNAKQMERLMKLTIRYKGKDLKFTGVVGRTEVQDDIDPDTDLPYVRTFTQVNFA